MTVVIPVFNPGRYLDRCVDSMLAQTLPPADVEVVFVDDGSTDDTPARLDELARGHPRFRVVHIPNSGWPGRPRNIGIATASGEYVQFLDQDDRLAPEALERLYEMGARNHADIVIGKVASDFRTVPYGVFLRNRDVCTIHDAPLIDSLTPHKMFRTAFLRDAGIAFPEGKRRLEDQLFMVRAYFAARRSSILADTVCYYYAGRDDGRNIGSVQIVPSGYYGNLREVLDVVLANTQPGPFRDRLLRRFYRVEILSRVSEPAIVSYDPVFRAELVAVVRELLAEPMWASVEPSLPPILRLRASLIRQGRLDDLVALSERLQTVVLDAPVEAAHCHGGVLDLRFEARLFRGPERSPLMLTRGRRGAILDPWLTEGIADPLVLSDLDGWKLEVVAREAATGVEWPVPVAASLDGAWHGAADGGGARFRAAGSFDPWRLAGGSPLAEAPWTLRIRFTGSGLSRTSALMTGSPAGAEAIRGLPVALGPRDLAMAVSADDDGRVSFRVADRGATLASAGSVTPEPLPGDGRAIEFRLPVVASPDAPSPAVFVRASVGERTVAIPARLEPRRSSMRLVAEPRPGTLPQGTWPLLARFADGTADLRLGRVEVDARGRLYLDRAARLGAVAAVVAQGARGTGIGRRGWAVRRALGRAFEPGRLGRALPLRPIARALRLRRLARALHLRQLAGALQGRGIVASPRVRRLARRLGLD